jgi:Ca2+-binding EF-hand superfamily protein
LIIIITITIIVLWNHDLYKEKISEQEHFKKIQVHKADIQNLYNKFSHGSMTANDVIDALYDLNLKPTKSCCATLTQSGGSDISFASFRTAIMSFDKASDDIYNKPAGSSGIRKHWQKENGEICEDSVMFNTRKRIDPEKRAASSKASTDIPKKKFVKSLAMTVDANGGLTTKFRSSSNAMQCLQPETLPTPLLSHNQQDLYQRITSAAIGTVKYTSEIKLQREQVIALIRKVHSAELSMEEFQLKLSNIGIELPEFLISELWRSQASGHLDVKRCVKILDAEIFKSRAIEENTLTETAIAIKNEFQNAIISRGCNSLYELMRVFITLDTDNSKSLSFSEFKKALRDFNLKADDNDVRLLFNYFDSSGDGLLSYDEFLTSLCPSLSPFRKKLVNVAFSKLDRLGQRQFSLETLVDNFNPTCHPDVIAGLKLERQVTTDLINFFARDNDDQCVTYDSFTAFYTFISGSIMDDTEFENMMKSCWNMKENDKAPPPPSLVSSKSGKQKIVPRSKQVYGDIIEWNQEPTNTELNESQESQKYSRKITDRPWNQSSFKLDDQVRYKNEDLDKNKNIKLLSHTMASDENIFTSYLPKDKPITEKKSSQKSLESALAEKKEKNDKRIKSLKEVLEDKLKI